MANLSNSFVILELCYLINISFWAGGGVSGGGYIVFVIFIVFFVNVALPNYAENATFKQKGRLIHQKIQKLM